MLGWNGSGADLEAGEPLHGGAGRVEDGLDRLLRLGDRLLLEQHDLLVEPTEATLDDLRDRLLGLALLAGLLLGDRALGLDDVRGDLVAGEVLGLHRGDLHRGGAGGGLVTLELDEHADGGRQVGGTLVHVGDGGALEVGDLAQLDLLADGDGQVLDDLADGLAVELGGLERRGVGGLDLVGDLGDLLRLGDEVLVLGDEVGLALELDQRVAGGGDEAGSGLALGAAGGGLGGTLDAEQLDGLVEVAVASVSAFLQSIIPAWVSSRSFLTSAAVKLAMVPLPWCQGPGSGIGVRSGRSAGGVGYVIDEIPFTVLSRSSVIIDVLSAGAFTPALDAQIYLAADDGNIDSMDLMYMNDDGERGADGGTARTGLLS